MYHLNHLNTGFIGCKIFSRSFSLNIYTKIYRYIYFFLPFLFSMFFVIAIIFIFFFSLSASFRRCFKRKKAISISIKYCSNVDTVVFGGNGDGDGDGQIDFFSIIIIAITTAVFTVAIAFIADVIVQQRISFKKFNFVLFLRVAHIAAALHCFFFSQ